MSWVYVVAGVLGYLLLMLALAGSATWAARLTASWLGLPPFRWFSEPIAPVPAWRLGVVRLIAAAAPWTVGFVLFSAGLWIDGVTSAAQDARVEVFETGAAHQAGVRSGDRITHVGGERVRDWDEMRAALMAHEAPVELEIERGGQALVVNVTPRSGKIGVALWMERRRVGAVGAAAAALPMPYKVVRSAVATAMGVYESSGEVGGPVRIVKETGRAASTGTGQYLTFLGMLAAYMWPFAAGVVLVDGVSSWLFRRAYPEAASSSARGYRLERQRQSLLWAYAGYVALAIYVPVTALGLSWALMLPLLATAGVATVAPLTWIVGSQFWRRSSVVLCLLLSFSVPCVALLVVFELRKQLTRALEVEGFRVTWLRATPPDAK